MTLELRAIYYDYHTGNYKSELSTSYENAVTRSVYNNASSGDYRSPSLESQLEETQNVMGRLIEHLVNKGLLNNEDFQEILDINECRPDFKLVEVHDV